MKFQGLTSCLFFSRLALLGLCIASHAAFADGSITTTPVQSQTEKDAGNGKSFLRNNLHDTSFDAASDANRALEKMSGAVTVECKIPKELENKPLPEQTAYLSACNKAKADVNANSGEVGRVAGSIARQQEIFSDISRVSDLAAIGAVGAVGVTMFTKNPSQVSSLENVAKIQRTAGMAAYATGATDFALGSYALAVQRQQLRTLEGKLQQTATVNGRSVTVASKESTITGVNTAIERTKQAAYKHMMMGAGKAAAGYMSMQMAKGNEEAAKNLKSLVPAQPPANVPGLTTGISTGGVPTYTNNQPSFFIPNSSGNSTQNNLVAPSNNTRASALGSSSLPTSANRLPAAAANKTGNGGVSEPGNGGGNSTGASAMPGGAAANNGASDATNETLNNFEINLTGGGSRYSGSAPKSGGDEAGNISNLFSNLLGNNSDLGQTNSAATGIRPIDLLEGAESSEETQASTEGVNNSGRSLFELTKSKHTKMLQAGRLTGPGEVLSR
jgi:hypothetical protein